MGKDEDHQGRIYGVSVPDSGVRGVCVVSTDENDGSGREGEHMLPHVDGSEPNVLDSPYVPVPCHAPFGENHTKLVLQRVLQA